MSESEQIRGIIIHAHDFKVEAGEVLDHAAVGLTLKVAVAGANVVFIAAK